MAATTPLHVVTTTAPEPAGDTLRSVSTALDVLDLFEDAEELGVSAIARRLGIAKSSAHRVLTTLCSRGYVEKNRETGLYRLGLHAFEIGGLARTRHPLHQAAMPLLEELRQVTGHTVHLAVIDGVDILFLERLVGPSSMRLMAGQPRRWPAHCTSSGHAIAAFNPEFAAARRSAGFAIGTARSVRCAEDYDRLVAATRRLGVGIGDEMTAEGLSSVAAPIRDFAGRAYAAVSVVGPTATLNAELGRTARLVTAVAGRLSKQMGIAC